MSWAAAGTGEGWDSGPAPTEDAFTSQDVPSYFSDADVDSNNKGYSDAKVSVYKGADHSVGGDEVCFNCGAAGHMKSDCPYPRVPREGGSACFRCGEEGHMKADCTNAAIEREFTGDCRLCGEQGHRAIDCLYAPPRLCKNCGQEDHEIKDCKNARLIDRDNVADVTPDFAWDELKQAAMENDLDDVKEALAKYFKVRPDTTYFALEKAFRTHDIGVYIIAVERELSPTYTNMDLQGNLDRTFTISYRLSPHPKRPKEAEGWPTSAEENMKRLMDAGEPVDRRVPLCNNCKSLGHTAKFCTEEKLEILDQASVKCFNCEEAGHRVRDCPKPRPDKFACRNCKQSGHSSKECPEPRSAEGVECHKCNETGHFSRDCPTGGGNSGLCRNCGKDGHHAKECTEPRDLSNMECRNCSQTGHMSKDCPKPRDYSRMQCQNCKQMGHSKVRCKDPFIPDDADVFTGNTRKGGMGKQGSGGMDMVPTGPVHSSDWS